MDKDSIAIDKQHPRTCKSITFKVIPVQSLEQYRQKNPSAKVVNIKVHLGQMLEKDNHENVKMDD